MTKTTSVQSSLLRPYMHVHSLCFVSIKVQRSTHQILPKGFFSEKKNQKKQMLISLQTATPGLFLNLQLITGTQCAMRFQVFLLR